MRAEVPVAQAKPRLATPDVEGESEHPVRCDEFALLRRHEKPPEHRGLDAEDDGPVGRFAGNQPHGKRVTELRLPLEAPAERTRGGDDVDQLCTGHRGPRIRPDDGGQRRIGEHPGEALSPNRGGEAHECPERHQHMHESFLHPPSPRFAPASPGQDVVRVR